MQKLAFVLLQLDEARRYIKDGRLEHVRLALLLLDNAAEIQMDRRIRDDWQHDQMMETLRKPVLTIPETKRGTELQELATWIPLTRAEKLKVDRYFDEKVTFMVGRGHFDARLAGPLRYVHRYRNEAYHRAHVRPETIRTAALVLLEINCQMILGIPPAGRSIASGEDFSWLRERFDCDAWTMLLDENKLRAIIDEIRSEVLPSDEYVATTLAEHLQSRFDELEASLTFIVENSRVPDSETALKESQYCAALHRTGGRWSQQGAAAFVPTYTLRSVRELETQLPAVSGATSRLDAFDCFSAVERGLEPIEECVNNLAAQIDMAIQAEVDRMRGK